MFNSHLHDNGNQTILTELHQDIHFPINIPTFGHIHTIKYDLSNISYPPIIADNAPVINHLYSLQYKNYSYCLTLFSPNQMVVFF